MESWLDPGSLKFSLFLLLAAAVGFFAASRAAADALAGNPHPRAGRLAVGHWLPIACTALLAVMLEHPAVALAVVFATSVASLTLVLGITSYVAPMHAPPGEGRALWPFVLPAALLALVAGLSGTIAPVHAGAMLILGITLLPLAVSRSDAGGGEAFATASSLPPPLTRARGLLSVQLALAIVLACLGAWAAVTATDQLGQRTRLISSTVLATGIVAPALVFPVLVTSGTLAQRGQSTLGLSVFVQIVLLNLCCLLPLVALLWYVRPVLLAIEPNLSDVYAAWTNVNPPIVFPMLTWRLDNVLLAVLGVMLIPISMGRWMLGRYEGMGLLIAYGMYLLLTMVMSVR